MNKTKTVLLAILVVLVMVLKTSPVMADSGGDVPTVQVSTYDELVSAINAAADGDVIGIKAMIYINDHVQVGDVDKHITLKRIDMGDDYTGIEIKKDTDPYTVKFTNLTFDGDKIPVESFVITKGNVTFENITFKNCYSPYSGGAIQIREGNVLIKNCIFDSNHGNVGGHISISSSDSVKIEGCTFKNGYGTSRAGAIVFHSESKSCIIKDSVISNNSAKDTAGAIENNGALTIENTKVFNNKAINGGNDISNSGTLQMEKNIEMLKALYKDENIIVKGWIEDKPVHMGTSYWKFDFELPPTKVILLDSSLGVAADGKITGLTENKIYKVRADGKVYYSRANGTLTEKESESEALSGTEIINLVNGKSYFVEEYIKQKPIQPREEETPSQNDAYNDYTGGYTSRVVNISKVEKKSKLAYNRLELDTQKSEYLIGYTDGLLDSKNTLTRSQFIQILYKLLTKESKAAIQANKNAFKDVKPSDWYYEAVTNMANTGLISPDKQGNFNPDKNITWGEMVSIMAKFAKPNNEWKIITRHWAKDALNTAISYRWFEYNDQFNPDADITRLEMLNLINTLFSWANKK